MKRIQHSRALARTAGITLLEALIALAIVSVGLLAIAKLHGDLLTGTAETKTRSEAVRLASAEIERLRGNPERLAVGDTTTGPLQGTNANFTVKRSIVLHPEAGTDAALHNAQVSVSWDSPWGGSDQVNVTSNIAWDNLGGIGNIARGRLPGGEPDGPRSGRERSGTEPLDPTDPDVTSRTVYQDYEERYRAEDGRRQIVRGDGVVIEIEDPDGIGFATISGFVFRASNDDDHDLGHFEVVRSDTDEDEACLNIPIANEHISREGDDTFDFATDILGWEGSGNNAYSGNVAMFYQCFAGSNWYGNTELLRRVVSDQGRSPTPHSVCLGDPEIQEPAGDPAENWGSRHLISTDRRRYRSETPYRGIQLGAALGTQPDFVVDADKLPGPDYYDQGSADDEDPEGTPGFGHHFVLTELGGCTPDDLPEGLRAPLEGLPAPLKGNVGQNYCFNEAGNNHQTDCSEPSF